MCCVIVLHHRGFLSKISFGTKSISQTHNLIKKGIKFIWQDLFSKRPGWLTLIIFNTRFCPRLPACGCCLLFQDFNLRLCKWAYRHVLRCEDVPISAYKSLERYDDPCRKQSSEPSDNATRERSKENRLHQVASSSRNAPSQNARQNKWSKNSWKKLDRRQLRRHHISS